MSPTLQDIARETQTSVSTVSRVLAGGTPAQRISKETRERVLSAAKRLGYRPNLVARSLRTRRSSTVALVVSDIANPWFGQVAYLIEQSLHRHGLSVLLCNTGENVEREIEYLRLLPQKGIDGMILVSLMHSREDLYEHLPENLPLVLFDRPIPGFDSVVASDQDQLANLLCDTLARAGIQRVAIVSGPHDVVTHRRRFEVVSQRFTVVASHEGPAQTDTGRQAFIKFLNLRPDAIVATNNFLGQGVIDAMADVQQPPVIACFDDIPMMHLLPLPIVCAMQDIPMLAEACVNQLLPQLNLNGNGAEPPKPILLPARAVTNAAFQRRHG